MLGGEVDDEGHVHSGSPATLESDVVDKDDCSACKGKKAQLRFKDDGCKNYFFPCL